MNHAEACKILGIAEGANPDEIKKAYRSLAKKYHPDLNQGDPEAETTFKRINEANDVLSRPEAPPSNFADPFEDLFRSFNMEFSSTFSSRSQIQHALTPGEFFSGGNFTISYTQYAGVNGIVKGTVSQIQVRLEPNTPVGASVRFPGKGNNFNGKPGDLVITFVVRSEPGVEVRPNLDLVMHHRISVFDAMLGAKVDLKLPDQTTIRVDIKPGAQHGSEYRIRGRGLPMSGGRKRSDILVLILVEIPNLTPEQANIVEETVGRIYGKNKEETQ